MKYSLFIGMVVGMAAATAICTANECSPFKKAKRSVIKKIESVL